MTQPVLVQSITDEFGVMVEDAPGTPVTERKILTKPLKKSDCVSLDQQTVFQKAVGKFIHLMKWTHTETANQSCELSPFMMAGSMAAHMKAVLSDKLLCCNTKQRLIVETR